MTELVADYTEDAFLGGRLRLRQLTSGHRAGHDAMLLAAATSARAGDRVVDFGAGVGAAGLALARRVGSVDLVLVEIDEALAELARGNAAAERNRCRRAACSMSRLTPRRLPPRGLAPDSADIVMINPPFNDAARHRASPDAARASAHVARETTLQNWVHAARRILKSGGALTLIWRADGIAEVLVCARSRLWQPCDPAGARRGRCAGNPHPGPRHQGRTGADANPAVPAAQGWVRPAQ